MVWYPKSIILEQIAKVDFFHFSDWHSYQGDDIGAMTFVLSIVFKRPRMCFQLPVKALLKGIGN